METTEMALEEACPHVKMASWRDLFTGSHCYQCMGCGHQIEIPIPPLCTISPEKEASIVGLVFGEKWREKLQGTPRF